MIGRLTIDRPADEWSSQALEGSGQSTATGHRPPLAGVVPDWMSRAIAVGHRSRVAQGAVRDVAFLRSVVTLVTHPSLVTDTTFGWSWPL